MTSEVGDTNVLPKNLVTPPSISLCSILHKTWFTVLLSTLNSLTMKVQIDLSSWWYSYKLTSCSSKDTFITARVKIIPSITNHTAAATLTETTRIDKGRTSASFKSPQTVTGTKKKLAKGMGVPLLHISKLNSTTVWPSMESITVMYRDGQGTNIRVPYKYGVFFKGENGMNLQVPHK